MSEFYPLRHNRLSRDINLLKKLELKQRQLEEKYTNAKKLAQFRRFTAHPSLLQSGSDTTTSCTPRTMTTTKFSSSTSTLVYGGGISAVEDTKQRAQHFHKLLHEKLSIIDSNPSERSGDFSEMGDGPQRSRDNSGTNDRYRNCRAKSTTTRSDSTIGTNSLNDEYDSYERVAPRSKKSVETERRKSASSRLSSQQSLLYQAKGIPDVVFESKFKAIIAKSIRRLADIKLALAKGVEPPDGDEDESRRLVRVKEFANRFSRNYLYPLARHVKDLADLSQATVPVANQKLMTTYQMLHNGLQAYQTHLPNSVGDCTCNQFKILLANIVSVCTIHRNTLREDEEDYIVEFVDTYKINTELTMQTVEERLTAIPNVKKEQSKVSVTEKSSKTAARKTASKSNTSKSDRRLTMYTTSATFRRDPSWKRAVEQLAKKKFNVKSKYKTATYKHRPPVQKDPDVETVPKLKTLFACKQVVVGKSDRLRSPINEDCIKTMVEAEQNGETHIEKEEWERMEKKTGGQTKQENRSSKETILLKLLQFTMKSHNKRNTNEGDDRSQINEILSLLKEEHNESFLKEIVDGLTDQKEANEEADQQQEQQQQLTLEIKSACTIADGASPRGKSPRKEPKITVTGDKNTRLICITDDNSVCEPPPEEPDEVKEPAKTSSETQTDVGLNIKAASKATQIGAKQTAAIKISRLKRTERTLRPLDKNEAVPIIQYKLDFYRYCKQNPMYKSSTTCQPWILMNKISEEILNHCLLTIAREIEINDIVDQVYQSELQM